MSDIVNNSLENVETTNSLNNTTDTKNTTPTRYKYKVVDLTLNDATGLNQIFNLVNKRTYFINLSCDKNIQLFVHNTAICELNCNISCDDIKYYCHENNISTDTLNISFVDQNVLELEEDVKSSLNELNVIDMVRLGTKSLEFTIEGVEDLTTLSETPLKIQYTYVIDNKSKKTKKKKHKTSSEPLDDRPNPDGNPELKEKWIQSNIELANKIFADIRNHFNKDAFEELEDKQKLEMFQNKYPRFNRQHPVCLRYMVQSRNFRNKAFEKYMRKVSDSKVGDSDVYLQRQADYLTLMWQELNPKYSAKQRKKVWEDAYNIIKLESKQFKDMQDTAEELADKVESQVFHEHKVELADQIEKLRNNLNFRDKLIKTTREENIEEYERKLAALKPGEEYESSDEELPDFSKIEETKKSFFADRLS